MTAKKNMSQKPVKQYIDLLYMTPAVLNARDLADLLQGTEGITTQLWEEMNVLELELPSGDSIDFEPLDPNFKDPSDVSFIKNRDIKTIYAIQLCEGDLPAVTPYFDRIVAQFSGFVCADTPDFKPVYSGSSQK